MSQECDKISASQNCPVVFEYFLYDLMLRTQWVSFLGEIEDSPSLCAPREISTLLWHIAYCHFEVGWSTRIQWDPVKQMLGSEDLNLGWALPVKHHWYQSQLQPDDWLRHLTVHRCTNKNITIYKEKSRYFIVCSIRLLVIHLHLLCIVCFVCSSV